MEKSGGEPESIEVVPATGTAPDPTANDAVLDREPNLYQKFTGFSTSKRRRYMLAIISAIILASILSYVGYFVILTSLPKYIYPNRAFNEPTKAGIDTLLSQSNNLFQIGLLLAGGICGLLIAKKGETTLILGDHPEIIMGASAAFLLLSSLLCYVFYIDMIAEIYSDAGIILEMKEKMIGESSLTPIIPDIFDPSINYMFIAQKWFLFSGSIISLLTFISAHKLKE